MVVVEGSINSFWLVRVPRMKKVLGMWAWDKRAGPGAWVSVWQEEGAFAMGVCCCTTQEAAEQQNIIILEGLTHPSRTTSREACFPNLFNISFHYVSYLNWHLVVAYYFSVLINVFWYPLAHLLKKVKKKIMCEQLVVEQVARATLLHFFLRCTESSSSSPLWDNTAGKTFQREVMLKWPELQSKNGNQTPNVNFVLPKLGKWKVFNMKLFSTSNHSSSLAPIFPSVFPLFLSLLSVFLKQYLYYTWCVPPFGIQGIQVEGFHKAWAGNLRRKGVLLKRLPHLWEHPKYMIALGNGGTNILSVPLEMEKGRIKILIFWKIGLSYGHQPIYLIHHSLKSL